MKMITFFTVNYSGCNGNNNRFLDEESCLNTCGHIIKQRKTELICSLPIEVGNCTDLLPRWAYHTRLRRCVPFYYSGCEGNDNLFLSKEECQEVCPTTFAPTIRLPRGGEILAERGSNATLHIMVKANPPATVQWFHRGQPISKYNHRLLCLEKMKNVLHLKNKIEIFNLPRAILPKNRKIKTYDMLFTCTKCFHNFFLKNS